MEKTYELGWLPDLIKQIPKTEKIPKTFFEIAGFPRRENVNSNTLAFYLDENEEHGFGRLFFNSLLYLLVKKGAIPNERLDLYETHYTVEREVYGDSKRIDILIKSSEG